MTTLRTNWEAGDPGHIAEHNEIARRLNTAFYVDSYGATGDGTTDDQAAIVAAIAAAVSAGGGSVIFTPGKTYAAADVIEVTGSNVTLSGYGATLKSTGEFMNTLLVAGTPGSPLQNVHILGLTIDANYAVAGGYQKRGLRFEYAHNCHARDVTVRNAFVGLHFSTGTRHCTAHACQCLDYDNDGFDAGGTGALVDADEPTYITFSNCYATSGGGSVDHAWEIEDGANHIKLIACHTDGVIGIRNHDTEASKTEHIALVGCSFGALDIANTYDTETNYVANVSVIGCFGTVTTSGTIVGFYQAPPE